MRSSRVGTSALVVAAALLAPGVVSAKDGLVMGVHPYLPAVELHKRFQPIADYVSRRLGTPVELRIGKTHEDTARRVGSGEFDFSFLGPNVYAKYGARHRLRPLAQILNEDGQPTFYGVVVVKKGSSIRSLRDLRGRSFAFGDRDSTLTHVVPVYMLLGDGVQTSDLTKVAFLSGSQDNLALNVAAGTFDATGLMPDIAARHPELQVIARSPTLPEHLFVASPSMDPALFARIQDALLGMDLPLMKGIKGSVTGMRKVNERDFDILKKILDTVEAQPAR